MGCGWVGLVLVFNGSLVVVQRSTSRSLAISALLFLSALVRKGQNQLYTV